MTIKNLETIIEKPLTKKQVDEFICTNNYKSKELKFKGNINYIRVHKQGEEFYFHKRRDCLWYAVFEDWKK